MNREKATSLSAFDESRPDKNNFHFTDYRIKFLTEVLHAESSNIHLFIMA